MIVSQSPQRDRTDAHPWGDRETLAHRTSLCKYVGSIPCQQQPT